MPDRLIAESACVDLSVKVGHNVVIGDRVRISRGCVIGNNVVIHADTIIGSSVRIDDNSVLGKLPMKAANSMTTNEAQLPPTQIGEQCIIGTSVVIYRGCSLGSAVLVADLATVREHVEIGTGTIVGRGVSIENNCQIGEFCKFETNAYLAAYSTVEDQCFIAPGVVTTNDNFVGRTADRAKYYKGVTVRKGGRIGANATILPGKTIGQDALVAAGGVVTKDVAEEKIYAGVPAREKGDVPQNQLLENQLPPKRPL
jgi:UDP-2-acetamido-3-amino-2,3-dideoxy-glucuronate N-acetyltransferase